ncbi:MAG: hypothetical protein JWR15_3054 [Prosthecobacter sp.]|nr:hypothetical protein [Prosthecobacter sp.]
MKVMQRTTDDAGASWIAQPAFATASIQPVIDTTHGLAMQFVPGRPVALFFMSQQPLFTKPLQIPQPFDR